MDENAKSMLNESLHFIATQGLAVAIVVAMCAALLFGTWRASCSFWEFIKPLLTKFFERIFALIDSHVDLMVWLNEKTAKEKMHRKNLSRAVNHLADMVHDSADLDRLPKVDAHRQMLREAMSADSDSDNEE